MKTLLLLRHAKPRPLTPGEDDFDRPLLEAGRADARLVAKTLLNKNLLPDAIISSTATRARETANIVRLDAHLSIEPQFDKRLYNADAELVLGIIKEVENDPAKLLVVAHNPGLADLIFLLTRSKASVTPGTLSRIDLNIEEWSDLRADGASKLAFTLAPGQS